jgi:hypothetical protein
MPASGEEMGAGSGGSGGCCNAGAGGRRDGKAGASFESFASFASTVTGLWPPAPCAKPLVGVWSVCLPTSASAHCPLPTAHCPLSTLLVGTGETSLTDESQPVR